MKELRVRKNEVGDYTEVLIKEYNNFLQRPRFYGKKANEYLKSLRIEIAERRKVRGGINGNKSNWKTTKIW